MKKEEFADDLVALFPSKSNALSEHYKDYGELLGHVFFAEEINTYLVALLRQNRQKETIKAYCKFIEKMWRDGTAEVQNIVEAKRNIILIKAK